MKKIIYTFLVGLMPMLAAAQTPIYDNSSQTGSRQSQVNPNAIYFDDAAISNATLGTSTSLSVTQVSVGIRRLAGASSVDVNVYGIASSLNNYVRLGSQSFGLNSSNITQVVTFGDGVTPIWTTPLIVDTPRFKTAYFGVRLSNPDANNGWRICAYPSGANTTRWTYGRMDTTNFSVSIVNYVGNTQGSFYLQIFANPVVLPVEMTTFVGKFDKQNVVLNWETATELNNNAYDIQRSDNGDNWRVVGTVKGVGTTNTPTKYTYTDASIQANQLYYYRLTDHASDGKTVQSKIIGIQTGDITKVIRHYLKGNPVSNQLVIDCQLPVESSVNVVITDVSGKAVFAETHNQLSAGEFLFEYDAANWANGIYFYNISTNRGMSASGKFLKKGQ